MAQAHSTKTTNDQAITGGYAKPDPARLQAVLAVQNSRVRINVSGNPAPDHAVMGVRLWRDRRFGVIAWAEDLDEAVERFEEFQQEEGYENLEIWHRLQ